MRRWTHSHPYVTLVLGYVLFLAAGTIVLRVVYGPLSSDSLFRAFSITPVYFLTGIFLVWRGRKREARLTANHQIRAYIRYPEDRPGSLSTIWNQGIATPSAGSILFQPAMYEDLVPSGKPTLFSLKELQPGVRKLTGKDSHYVGRTGLQVMTMLTESGQKVEIAARPEALQAIKKIVENISQTTVEY